MMAGLDVELRWLFWWRLGALVGGGIGKVFPAFDGFGPQPWLPSAWAGLLYKVMDDSDIRVNLTVAVSKSGGALYFSLGTTF
jgi:predicted branched-subunit amino acid permease